MAQHIAFILGGEHYTRLDVPAEQKTVTCRKRTYNLRPHKRLHARRMLSTRSVWIFRKGHPEPLDVTTIAKNQDYKKISPSALKIIVSQNIEHTFFKSLLEKGAGLHFGRRRLIAVFIAVAVAVVALKAAGVY